MEKYNLIIEYLNFDHILGCSDLAPLICMINEDTKIVKELLKDSDFEHKNNLISFLDYGVRNYLKNTKTSERYDLKETYNAITYVLKKWEDLENKWSISGDQFIKCLVER